MAEVVKPVTVYAVQAVGPFGAVGILGIYEDEIDALREANETVGRKMTPYEIIPRQLPARGISHGDGGR